tara:strand:+ start:190 stop:501 length:312 start_codon:yes stop_codon:yes gene_type:complete
MRRLKYNNKKVVIDGIKFDSIRESKRYLDLKNLERGGDIKNLELQPRYDFVLNGVKMGFYKADFRYVENGVLVIEDVKGMKTPVYNLKKKMMKAFHNINILET